jgi:hypothetical protein
MKVLRSIAIVVVVAVTGLLLVSATAQAYDFANICPAQPPPKWAGSAATWSQFVDSCISNDASARAGRASDRRFWDNCIKTCGLANDAEGRVPPKPAQTEKQTTTSGTPANPNWCSDVPASPPPPHFENKPGDWAYIRSQCMKKSGFDVSCFDDCLAAKERWARAKAGTLNLPEAPKDSTTVPQGPFPLPGGGSGYIAPLPPRSGDAASTTDLALNSVLSAGPFSSFPGLDLIADLQTDGQPPDVSADVSSTQNVEFINGDGLAVWNKPALPVPSPAPTPAVTDPVTFWCGSNGVNNQPLLGCSGGMETLDKLTDTQIGYDASLGRWIATELARDPDGMGFIYLAVSVGSSASGWEKWSDDACLVNPMFPSSDQPLLGWSNSSGVVVVDTVCATAPNGTLGPDELHIIPNTTITSGAPSLPLAIQAPCQKMAPARDEQGSFSNVYLLASIIPGTVNQSTCAPSSSNTDPYVVEYTANASGVFGSGGACPASGACSPVSTSPQWGDPALYVLRPNAQQLGCSTTDCQIIPGDARITAAQIRPSSVGSSSSQSPILAGGFATGINVSGSTEESQNIWFIQNVSTGSWLDMISLAGGGDWFSYPTIAIDNDQDLYLGSTHFRADSYQNTI